MNASHDPDQPQASRAKRRSRSARQSPIQHDNDHDHDHEHDDEREGPPLELEVTPFGLTADDEPRLREALLAHPEIRGRLADCDYRLLSFQLVDSDEKSVDPCPSSRYVASVFDYTNGRLLLARGDVAGLDFDSPGSIEVEDVSADPLPSADEFAAAVDILRHDRSLRAQIDEGTIEPYAPMPPLVDIEMPDGRRDRTIAVGLRENDGELSSHRIVGANLFSRRLIDLIDDIRFPPLKPCEPPPGSESCASTGSTGQVTITVSQGGQQIWRFVAVRPAASSGKQGSGIELRYVDYKGKRVLYRAHVPILNVEYLPGAPSQCGPTYRDWQNGETCFQANGVDVIPGFRLCSSPATTILDTGADAGNFQGVAIYVQGQEVVLVSEMSAGWYRYISEWRLRSDGTIRPIFGFAAIDNPCTCSEHVHHAYWRFDFDIRTAWNNQVEEYNDPPLIGNSNWHTKSYETRRPRDETRKRSWKVSNVSTGEGYVLVPGIGDGEADAYGVGDVWVLRYNGSELEDGQGFTNNPALSRANLDKFRTPAEPVTGTDVVLWYTGHFRHDQAHAAGHRVGPTLRPVNW
jgi:hypothetical protein